MPHQRGVTANGVRRESRSPRYKAPHARCMHGGARRPTGQDAVAFADDVPGVPSPSRRGFQATRLDSAWDSPREAPIFTAGEVFPQCCPVGPSA